MCERSNILNIFEIKKKKFFSAHSVWRKWKDLSHKTNNKKATFYHLSETFIIYLIYNTVCRYLCVTSCLL